MSIEEAGPDPCVTLKHRLRGQLVGSKMSLSLEGHPYEALFPEQSWAKGVRFVYYNTFLLALNFELTIRPKRTMESTCRRRSSCTFITASFAAPPVYAHII